MCTGEQASAEKRLRLQPKVMDPDERRRRLRKAYDILLALVRDGSLPLTEANALLAEMIGRRYRSPVGRLDELI